MNNQFKISEREKLILFCIIQQYILNATPIGSRFLTKKYSLGLSSATIRNIMADLEEMGFLDHPHTSAGRIPTDKGYRYFVDNLMKIEKISEQQQEQLYKILSEAAQDSNNLLESTSQILSKLTNLISYVSYPKLHIAILEKIQLVYIDSNKILVVVIIKKGPIKTITFEIDTVIRPEKLYFVEQILNEKLSGLSFKDIQYTIKERISENIDINDSVIRFIIDYSDKIFSESIDNNNFIVYSDAEVLNNPEFENYENLKAIIEILQDKSIIVHLVENIHTTSNDVVFKIGEENPNDLLKNYSIAYKQYKKDNFVGNIVLVGPKRMNYSKVTSLLNFTSEIFSNHLKI